MSRTYVVPGGASSITQTQERHETFIESGGDYFFTSAGDQFYVKKEDGTTQLLNNIFTREAESRSYEVPN